MRYLTLLLSVACFVSAALAADHGDSPSVRLQSNLDINDVYLFQSPATTTNTVMIMTVSPLAGITGSTHFDDTARYEFVLDKNADAKADAVYAFKFSKANAAGVQRFTLTRTDGKGKHGKVIAKGSTGSTATVTGGGQTTASEYDDPFFFDLLSFKNGLAFCNAATQRNFFAGLNTNAIVLEVPTSSLEATGSTKFGIWARTIDLKTLPTNSHATVESQFDRMGRPAINTVLVKAENKDKFNKSSPATDRAKYEADAIAIMQTLGNSASGAQTVGDILFPDILTIDASQTTAYPNGRALADDVIDTSLNLVSGGHVTTDCITNDSNFSNTFPYLAAKNPG